MPPPCSTINFKTAALKATATAIPTGLYQTEPALHILAGEARSQDLLRGFEFGSETSVHRLTLEKGWPYREDVECARLAEEEKGGGEGELTIYFLRCLPRKQIALTAEAFAHLLQALGCTAPPSYLEVLANNNGLFHSYSLDDQNSLPGDYYLMAKFPFGPFSNGSVLMYHSHTTNRTTCIIFSTRAQILVERLFDIFSNTHFSSSIRSPSKPPSHHPFLPVATFLEHSRIANEDDRHDIDQCVCRIENRSGVSLHNFGSRARAKIGEYALLQRELHMQDALIVMADHCFSFHKRFAEFVVDEAGKFTKFEAEGRGFRQGVYVRALLKQNASMSTWTLEQLRALEKRLKVQLRVIDSTIAATDTLTTISLARASANDSNTMKAITILTMVFLPATFVCSLFSMGFFDFGQNDPTGVGESRIHVVGQFWIYFAVAVPLTVVVLGICAAWLLWSGRQGERYADSPPTGEAKRLD